ncbi:MAG: hypothetical protein Q7R96_01570 [Nanoarchaeota archaeon]|nr:hypothetical protein [Nanoarchaeota archaeon]
MNRLAVVGLLGLVGMGCKSVDDHKEVFSLHTVKTDKVLQSSLKVNVKDKHVSIDEVFAEAGKFDANDSIAREISLYMVKCCGDIKYLIQKTEGSEESCLVHKVNKFPRRGDPSLHVARDACTSHRKVVRLVQGCVSLLADHKHPLAEMFATMLKDMSYATIDFVDAVDESGFYSPVHPFELWKVRYTPFSGASVREKMWKSVGEMREDRDYE